MDGLQLAPLLYAVVAAVASVVSLTAAIVLLAAATGEFRARIDRYLGQEGGISLVAGLAALAHGAVGALLLAPWGRLGLAAIGVLGAATLGLILVGLSALSIRAGRRVGAMRASGEPFSDLAAVLVGAPLLALTGFVPLFGWVVLSYAAVVGLGATLRALLEHALEGIGPRRLAYGRARRDRKRSSWLAKASRSDGP